MPDFPTSPGHDNGCSQPSSCSSSSTALRACATEDRALRTCSCSSLHASGTSDASSRPGLHAHCTSDWSDLRTCGTSRRTSLCAHHSSGCSRLHASCTSGCSSLHASDTCDASSRPGLHAQCASDWSNLRTCGTSDCSRLHAHGCIGLCAHRASTCSSARRTTTSLKARRCVVRTHAVGTFPSCASSSCSSFTVGTEDDDRGRKPGDGV
ncbi:uncharacterized protein LOC117520749 [Thalassophryne amazonica]|uniref:uncharacterized protein LOC117520749 n=1 Tax=Thalassophryne amazonica TaxID=390379 RepID=UPI001472000E|nr:uncharacterized protein LOC117520749 [Thalassophryne amazonica]